LRRYKSVEKRGLDPTIYEGRRDRRLFLDPVMISLRKINSGCKAYVFHGESRERTDELNFVNRGGI
jgi:hypothetical protein